MALHFTFPRLRSSISASGTRQNPTFVRQMQSSDRLPLSPAHTMFSWRDSPKPYRAIGARRRKEPPIGAESHFAYPLFVASKHRKLRTSRDVPQAHRAVTATGSQNPPVGAESDVMNPIQMTGKPLL